MRRQAKPRPERVSSTIAIAPASAGVTEGRRTSALVSSTASMAAGLSAVMAALYLGIPRCARTHAQDRHRQSSDRVRVHLSATLRYPLPRAQAVALGGRRP